jgi:cytosine/adenosine deaminase-related metal-dependent hydrolase
VADILGLARHGVVVGLGTDAMTTSMLEELRAALWTQRLYRRNPSAWEDVLATLFGNNAEIAERIFYQELGVLQIGSPADIAIFEYDPPTPWTNENAFGHIVFGLSQAPVDTTIVAGRVLMQNRKLRLNLDEERIHARARELATHLWKKL